MKTRLIRWLSIPVRGNWQWVIALAVAVIVIAVVGGSWWDGP
jgi:hypothetical protein